MCLKVWMGSLQVGTVLTISRPSGPGHDRHPMGVCILQACPCRDRGCLPARQASVREQGHTVCSIRLSSRSLCCHSLTQTRTKSVNKTSSKNASRIQNSCRCALSPRPCPPVHYFALLACWLLADKCDAEDDQKNQGLIGAIAAKITNNIQITVKNIHIRYEDSISCPGVRVLVVPPSSAGLTRPYSIRLLRVSLWRASRPSPSTGTGSPHSSRTTMGPSTRYTSLPFVSYTRAHSPRSWPTSNPWRYTSTPTPKAPPTSPKLNS